MHTFLLQVFNFPSITCKQPCHVQCNIEIKMSVTAAAQIILQQRLRKVGRVSYTNVVMTGARVCWLNTACLMAISIADSV